MNSGIIAPIISLGAGGVLATMSVFGVITSQTSAPAQSPANAEAPAFDYGTTTE